MYSSRMGCKHSKVTPSEIQPKEVDVTLPKNKTLRKLHNILFAKSLQANVENRKSKGQRTSSKQAPSTVPYRPTCTAWVCEDMVLQDIEDEEEECTNDIKPVPEMPSYVSPLLGVGHVNVPGRWNPTPIHPRNVTYEPLLVRNPPLTPGVDMISASPTFPPPGAALPACEQVPRLEPTPHHGIVLVQETRGPQTRKSAVTAARTCTLNEAAVLDKEFEMIPVDDSDLEYISDEEEINLSRHIPGIPRFRWNKPDILEKYHEDFLEMGKQKRPRNSHYITAHIRHTIRMAQIAGTPVQLSQKEEEYLVSQTVNVTSTAIASPAYSQNHYCLSWHVFINTGEGRKEERT